MLHAPTGLCMPTQERPAYWNFTFPLTVQRDNIATSERESVSQAGFEPALVLNGDRPSSYRGLVAPDPYRSIMAPDIPHPSSTWVLTHISWVGVCTRSAFLCHRCLATAISAVTPITLQLFVKVWSGLIGIARSVRLGQGTERILKGYLFSRAWLDTYYYKPGGLTLK